MADSDMWGKILIPANNAFFLVLTTENIIILTSRADKMVKAFEIVDVKGLDPVKGPQKGLPMKEWTGGLEYLGADFEEGACFKLKKGNSEWVICSQDPSSFGQLLHFLVKIMLYNFDPKRYSGLYGSSRQGRTIN